MLNRLSEAYRRVRNTFRFILGNLSDFDPAKDAVSDADLLPLDRWALLELRSFLSEVDNAYENYEFTRVFHELDNYCAVTLSSRYFDILKDRLYTHASSSTSRRSAQTVLVRILKSMATAVAPILSFTAEEVWQSLPPSQRGPESVFLSDFPEAKSLTEAETKDLEEWARLFAVREESAKALEGLRRNKVIGSSLEAEVDLYVAQDGLRALLEGRGEDLRYDFLVARVGVHASPAPEGAEKAEKVEGLWVKVAKTQGAKCARCWNYYPTLGSDPAHSELCDRCAPVVKASEAGQVG
jgi:isoleucyl-tRNA synthetase